MSETAPPNGNNNKKKTLAQQQEIPFWDWDANAVKSWIQKQSVQIGDETAATTRVKATALDHLILTLSAVTVEPLVPEGGEQPPPTKRRKTPQKVWLQDPYRVWLHQLPKEELETLGTATGSSPEGQAKFLLLEDNVTVPDTPGGRLAQVTAGGLWNAVAAVSGGVTSRTTLTTAAADGQLPQPANAALLWEYSVALHRAVRTKVEADLLRTTPSRIHQWLAADLSEDEFKAVRKRVYDTVVLGRGLHTGENGEGAAGDDQDPDVLAAPPSSWTAQHDVERFHKCPVCGNQDQGQFDLDRKNGDIVCCNCGVVVAESLMHEGTQYRKFEGEADRNHHGDAHNPLYSNQHNLSTTLGMQGNVGDRFRGQGRMGGGGRNWEVILRNAHAYTELNVSQFGKTDRRTRVGYKDKQKKDAFLQMTHAGDALNLHEAVVQRAKELFAGFRDDRELVQQFKGVIAACLCEAFEQLSRDGQKILKMQQDGESSTGADNGSKDGPQKGGDAKSKAGVADKNSKAPAPAQPEQPPVKLSARAARRNELHHVNMAGKGGLLLDLSTVGAASTAAAANGNGKKAVSTPTASTNGGPSLSPKAEEKPAVAWDLDDCRSWLLEASRSIAQQWTVEQQKDGPLAKQIPAKSTDELEGRLVEHSITLCEQLEKELKARQQSSNNRPKHGGVVTPRVQDMSKLGIKWQKLPSSSGAPTNGSHRTAGQILILKTAKKLGSILNDPLAGNAFHKELRGVIGRQEERKRLERREEASRQRFNQMKRKPWLQARLEQTS